jgi:hypothetical protein
MDRYARPVLALILSTYSKECRPTIGNNLLKKGGLGRRALFGGQGFDDKESSILWNVPEKVLVEWARTNKGAPSLLLSLMALFTVDDQGEFHWRPSALALLNKPHDDRTFGAVVPAAVDAAGAVGLDGRSSTGGRPPPP